MPIIFIVFLSLVVAAILTFIEKRYFLRRQNRDELYEMLHIACGAFYNAKLSEEQDFKVISHEIDTFITGYTLSLIAMGYNAKTVHSVMEQYINDLANLLTE